MRSIRVLFVAATACCGGAHLGADAGESDATIDAGDACDGRATVAAGASFGAGVTLSDPANQSFLPAVAVHGGTVVVAWHDFPAGSGTSRVVTTTIVNGCVGPIEVIADPLAGPKRPTIAATSSGFVLAWDATDGTTSVVRTIDLGPAGHAIGEPVTVSAPGASASEPRVAAAGDDVAWVWTDGSAHYFARRGPVETVAASPIGTTLLSTGLLNFPRVAVAAGGAVFVAYRDGGSDPQDWDVLLVTRAVGAAFSAPIDVSNTAGLLSDDITLAIEGDDTLDLVWVDQDAANVEAFEVDYATRTAAGAVSSPRRFGSQGAQSWTPSVAPGLSAVWDTGAATGGAFWLAPGSGAPQAILPAEQGSMVALARGSDGALDLAFVTTTMPRQVRFAARTP